MRPTHLGIAVVALVTLACPQGGSLLGNSGFGIGNSGGGGTHKLAFTVQPSGAAAGNIMTPAIQVTVQDSAGKPDSSFTAAVTMGLGSNLVGGTLSGTLSIAPTNSIAVFGDLRLDKAGSGYTLRASAAGANSIVSNSFTISP